MELDLDYTINYHKYVNDILKCSTLNNALLKEITQLLKINYQCVDIGSCNGVFANDIMNINKNGIFESVDPYPLNDNIINMKGEDFIKLVSKNMYDIITCFYSIHLLNNLNDFFYNCYNALNETGIMYIITLSPNSIFPWTSCINKHFVESCINIDNYVYQQFNIEKTTHIKKIKIAYNVFENIIKNRAFSNLYKNTDDEINSCIMECKNKYEKNMVEIILEYYIYKLSK
jgi:SAM-dependent methyltransferase